MRIDDKFGFGKYANFSLREVYQGCSEIDHSLLLIYLNNRISEINREFVSEAKLLDEFDIKINESIIELIPKQENIPNDSTLNEKLEKIFRNGERWEDGVLGIMNIRVLKNHINYKEQHPIISDLSYIAWCLKTVDGFHIHPVDIDNLQKLPVYDFTGIEIHRIKDNTFSFHPKFKERHIKFHEKFMATNLKKYEQWNSQDDGDFDEDDYRTEERDNPSSFQTFKEYNGSYAQDILRFSDQYIDDVFDGDSDAYWNID